jgi:peptidoglycan/LPS O-acetylase OafA/YrhL
MNPTSPFPAFVGFAIALTTVFLLSGLLKIAPQRKRISSIDGLRGYLAYGVFLHHSVIWYYYLHTGHWSAPPSSFYQHLGQTSVALFFMITGFLFYSKILSPRPIDWTRLFVSRVLRLTPLYFVVILLVFVVVGVQTEWELREPWDALIGKMLRWILFLQAEVNQLKTTKLITAGVTWSLPYEWSYYFALPLLALISGRRPSGAVLSFAALSVFYVHFGASNLLIFEFFLGGIGAAFLVRKDWFCRLATRRASGFVVLVCMSCLVTYFPNAFGRMQLLLNFVAFSLIAAGNSMFGIFTSRVSRTLGEITYSIYLLHGVLLYVLLELVLFGNAGATLPTPFAFWSIVLGATPVLVILSMITFRFIEQPAMQHVDSLSLRLKTVRFSLRSSRVGAEDIS